MPFKILPFGIIILPSIRSLAYLTILSQRGVAPQEIIMMTGRINKLQEVVDENKRYAYERTFFDVNFNITQYLSVCGAKVIMVETSDINSPLIQNVLQQSGLTQFIYSGGGIVKAPIFATGKKLIHVHPGIVPTFRGSTCFYYSLLENGLLGATAFYMDQKIDTGQIIAQSHFRINYRIQADQPLFVDYILDSYIRAQTLQKVLVLLSQEAIDPQPQGVANRPAYFVMHPLLRHVAINKINRLFDSTKEIGIFEV